MKIHHILLFLILSNCSTNIKTSYRQIIFNSRPQGATIILDNIKIGKTPTVARIEKKKYSKLIFSKKGFKKIIIKIDNNRFKYISFLDLPLADTPEEILSKAKVKNNNKRAPASLNIITK